MHLENDTYIHTYVPFATNVTCLMLVVQVLKQIPQIIPTTDWVKISR